MADQALAYPGQFSTDLDLPPFNGSPRPYLIASTPRCGSHFLGHALMEMGGFGVPLEYLNGGNFAGWKARFGDKRLPHLIEDFLRHRTSENGRFGFKAHWSQFRKYLSTGKIDAILPLTHVVLIYRSNLLGQAISFAKAAQTGQWISGAPAQGEAVYNYAEVAKAAGNIRRQYSLWSTYLNTSHEGPIMRIDYADLIADQEGRLRAIARFLEPEMIVEPRVSAKTRKQSDEVSKIWQTRFLADLKPEDQWITRPFHPEGV